MAKLYFYFSAMNAGKTTTLLQSAHNYRERGMRVAILTPKLDFRAGSGTVASRIRLQAEGIAFERTDDLRHIIDADIAAHGPLHCVLVDEAQFLSKAQAWQLSEVVDALRIRSFATACAPISAASCSKAASTCWRGPTNCRRSRRSATAARRRR